MKNEKYLGIDLGSKTIGLSISNGVVANPYKTIGFTEWDFEQAIDKLTLEIEQLAISTIIIGYPKNMDGSIGERAEMVDYFIEGFLLSNHNFISENIVKVDERRTTKMAKSIMIEAGISRQKQKESKDSLAAQLILEQYLNSIKG